MNKNLRKLAEQQIQQGGLVTDTDGLIHELQVHQVELEMQNEELRTSQHQLAVARDNYVELYDFAPIGYVTLDEAGRIMETNFAAAALLGTERGNLLQEQTFARFISRDSLDTWEHYYRRILSLVPPHQTELVLQRMDGSVRNVHVECMPRPESGRYLMTLSDITRQVQTETKLRNREQELDALNRELEQRIAERTSALKESEERFRMLFEESPDTCLLLDQEGRFIDGNKAVEQLTGYSREELRGQSIFESPVIPAAARKTAAERLKQLLSGKAEKLDPAIYSLRQKDGSELTLEVTTMPIVLQGETVLLSSARDLTPRKKAEAERIVLERQRQLALDAAQLGCWYYTPETGLITYDRRMADIFGLAGSECPLEQILLMISPDDAPNVRGTIEAAMNPMQPQVHAIEYRLHHPNGSTRWIESHGQSEFAGRGTTRHATSLSGTVSDITERKHLQEALEKRVLALTRPLDQPEGIAFDDLFDRQSIQRIQDEFSQATGVASVITAPDGTPITKPSNFSTLCSDIILKTEEGCANCICSDTALQHHSDGPMIRQCKSSGLWDAWASINVCGQHIANWVIGQARDESQTTEQLRAYAEKIGADENAFMDAFYRIPTMNRDQFAKIAQALSTLANQLSTSAYMNMQQARFITDQKRAEAALQESEEKYRLLFESETDAVLLFDGKTRKFIDVNQAAINTYGYSRAEFLQLTHWDITTDQDMAEETIRKTLKNQTMSSFRSSHRKKDGSVFPVEITGSSFQIENRPVVCGVVRDVTERVKKERELLRSREELRHLASELSLAGQQERQRISHELHDGICQLLSSSRIRLDALKAGELPTATVQSLDKICDIIGDTLQQARTLIFELSCPLLRELGLAAALEELCSSMSSGHSVTIEFISDFELLPLSIGQKTLLYRSVRELLVNVVKHSGAKWAGVTLKQENGKICICIEDNGKGFDASSAGTGFSPTGGFGLFNLCEYIRHAGGEISIHSTPGSGTTINLSLLPEISND